MNQSPKSWAEVDQRAMETKIKELEMSLDFYRLRIEQFKSLAYKMPDPWKTLAFDIIANGSPRWWGVGEGIIEQAKSEDQ